MAGQCHQYLFKTEIFNILCLSEHQSLFIQVHVSSFDHSLYVHVFSSQACHIEGGSAGLIPSQLLEEKRKAFVKRDLELATTGTPLSGTQQSREALLIMQIGHRPPRCTNTLATKTTSVPLRIIQAFHVAPGRSHLSSLFVCQ